MEGIKQKIKKLKEDCDTYPILDCFWGSNLIEPEYEAIHFFRGSEGVVIDVQTAYLLSGIDDEMRSKIAIKADLAIRKGFLPLLISGGIYLFPFRVLEDLPGCVEKI